MKSIEKISAYSLTAVLLLFVSFSSYGQSRQDKTIAIIKEMKIADPYKMNYEYRLKPLMNQATGSDSVKLGELEKHFTNEHITKVISRVFDEILNDEELNGIYNFLHSSTYKKLVNPGSLFELISNKFIDINNELDSITNSMKNKMERPVTTFEPIPMDREDGFYATMDYNQTDEVKDIKLQDKPFLTTKDILEVTKGHMVDNIQELNIQFTKEGAQKYYLFTKENIRKPMAIVIAKHIVSMPTINMAIMGGKVSITGRFTDDEVDEMIAQLKEKK